MPGGGKELPTTVESAAVAFAEGDAEKKISMLKKALINLTKQKNEIEQRCASMEEKLALTAAELASVHQQNAQLTATIQANNAEIDGLKKKLSTSTAASVASAALKGITNFIPLGGGGGGGGGASELPAPSARSTASTQKSSSFVALSPEDQQRMFEENEALHIQIFELRSSLEAQVRSLEKTNGSQAAQITALKKSLSAAESSIASAKDELETLKQTAKEDRMVAHYLTCFSELHVPPPQVDPSFFVPAVDLRPGNIDRHLSHFLSTKIEQYLELNSSLVAGVGTLLSALDDSVGRVARSTNSDENSAMREHLRTAVDAHRQFRVQIVDAVAAIRVCLAPPDSSTLSAPSTWQAFHSHVQVLARAMAAWLGMIRNSLPLMTECAVALFPRDHVFIFAQGTAQQAAGSRDLFVSMLVRHLSTVMSSAIAGLRVASSLLGKVAPKSCEANGGGLLDWSVLLWWILWRSSEACGELADSCSSSTKLMHELAEQCGDDRAQIAVRYLAQIVHAVASSSTSSRGAYEDPKLGYNVAERSRLHLVDDARSEVVEELTEALRQADASAVRHYVQLQRVLLELHEQQGATEALRCELARQQKESTNKETELQHVVNAYEEQIRLLSDRLADLA